MERIKSLLYPITAAVALMASIVLIGNAYEPYAPVATPVVPQTVSGATVPTLSNTDTASSTAPLGAVATNAAPVVEKKPAPPTKAPATLPTATVPQAVLDASLSAATAALRAALVNIICYAPLGGGINSISGSGIIIDPKGIILTNAHIAQYFLLADRGVSCKVRSGSPASDQYAAGLLYLPPQWVHDNATLLTDTLPSGTGERDFAFLGITKSLSPVALPTAFPSLPLATLPLAVDAPVVIGSYGAQFLTYGQIQSDLFPTIVFGSVKGVFTFTKNSIDVFALGGSAAAQEGSSGGGVVNALGELAGTIVTSTMEEVTSSRQLNALSASYIRSEFASETGASLDTLLATPLPAALAAFAPIADALEASLVANLP